jgi:hypothetical protein
MSRPISKFERLIESGLVERYEPLGQASRFVVPVACNVVQVECLEAWHEPSKVGLELGVAKIDNRQCLQREVAVLLASPNPRPRFSASLMPLFFHACPAISFRCCGSMEFRKALGLVSC